MVALTAGIPEHVHMVFLLCCVSRVYVTPSIPGTCLPLLLLLLDLPWQLCEILVHSFIEAGAVQVLL